MINLLDEKVRREILADLRSPDNMARKAESSERSEVYNKRAGPIIDKLLAKEFPETSKKMRKMKSINIAKRTTDKLATVYQNEPTRSFLDADGKELPEDKLSFIKEMYAVAKANTRLQRTNRVKRYQNQATLQVLPVDGKMAIRVYQPHEVDAIPSLDNPERADGYIVSPYITSFTDTEALERIRMVWWSKDFNFITDGNGAMVSTEFDNPIKRLPFIDAADNKENEFWIRAGNAIIDFALEFAVVLSDTANINRAQAYAQGIIKDVKKPELLVTGPENFVWLQLPKEPGAPVPSIEFVSPTPNLDASLKLLDQYLSYFLTAEGIDPKIVSSGGEGQKFSSGLERFLSQVEAFAASREDLDLFSSVEDEVFEIMKAWVNTYQGTLNSPIKMKSAVAIPEDAYLLVKFGEPELIQSRKEREESEFYLVDKGVSSLVMAVMKLDHIDEEAALAKIQKVRKHQAFLTSQVEGGATAPAAPEAEVETEEEDPRDLLDLTGKESA